MILVLLAPRANVRKSAQPIDAGIGPELDEQDFPAQAVRRQGLRIEPGGPLPREDNSTVLLDFASAEPIMPNWAAAIVKAALPTKRRRSWLISADISLSPIRKSPAREARAGQYPRRVRLRQRLLWLRSCLVWLSR